MSEVAEESVGEFIDLTGLTAQPGQEDDGYEFGRFVFFPERQILLSDGAEVRLGNRASVILKLLIDRARQVVTKEEIFNAAWPSAGVEEVNLRVQIATLRKALGDNPENPEYVTNVAGRGYLFLKSVDPRGGARPADVVRIPRQTNARSGLPAPMGRIIGRESAITDICRLIEENRLVTVVGPGGVGKTSVAVAAAQQMSMAFDNGMLFIDLSDVEEDLQLPVAVARALNAYVDADDAVGSLAANLDGQQLLVVLDNCEHVVDAVAYMAEALLRAVPDLRILATSHEPLRAEAEWVFRLLPLDVPSSGNIGLNEARQYSAIRLFSDRAAADNREIVLKDADVPLMVEICRRLDGMPLAIEIIAARVGLFGLNELASRLHERLDVPNESRRTAVRRHKSIRSAFDWAYGNLSEVERVVLRRLGVFPASFSLDAAISVAGVEGLSPSDVTEAISGLVRKSFLLSDLTGTLVAYRLLEVGKLYAAEHLHEAGETFSANFAHARHVEEALELSATAWEAASRISWVERYGDLLREVAQSLAWTLSAEGDLAIGVRLTVLSVPFGIRLGLPDAFAIQMRLAVSQVLALELEPESRMKLDIYDVFLNVGQEMLEWPHTAVRGDDGPDTLLLLLQLAEFKLDAGDWRAARECAENASALAEITGI